MTARAEPKKRHEHEWFPVAIDYDSRFLILECTGCTVRTWANAHSLQPEDDL